MYKACRKQNLTGQGSPICFINNVIFYDADRLTLCRICKRSVQPKQLTLSGKHSSTNHKQILLVTVVGKE